MGIVELLRRLWAARASRKRALRSKRRHSHRSTFRPMFDVLEDRLAPTAHTITSDTTWSAEGIVAGDTVIVKKGHTLTVNVTNGQAASIQLGDTNPNHGDGTLSFGNSTCRADFSGNVTVGDATDGYNGTVNMSSGGTLDIGAAFTLTAGQSTFTSGNGTVVYDSTTANQTVTATTYHNLTISDTGHTATLAGNTTVTGLTINSGSTFALAGNNFSLSANAAVANSGTFQLDGNETLTNVNNLGTANGTVMYVGNNTAGPLTIKTFTGDDYYNLTINDTNPTKATFQLGDSTVVDGAFTLTSSTFSQMANPLTVAGNFSLANGTTYNKATGNGTLTFNGAGTITDSNASLRDLGNVTITGNSTRTLGSAANMTGLTINSGSTFALAGNNFSLSANVAVANSGTFQLYGNETLTNVSSLGNTTGTVIYVGNNTAGPLTIKTFSGGYNNLTINDTNTTKATFQLGANTGVAGAFTLTSGTFSQNANNTLTVAGNFSLANGTTYNKATGNGTLTLSGTGNLTDSNATLQDLGAVSVGGNRTLTTSVTMDSLSVTANGTLIQGSANTLTIGGNLSLANGATFTKATTTGALVFNGTGTITDSNASLRNLGNVTITGNSTRTLSSAANMTGLTINSGSTYNANGQTTSVTGLTTVSGGVYNASTGNQTLSGGLTVSGGTFTGSTGVVTTSTVTLSSGNLTAPSTSLNLSGNFTNNGGNFTNNGGTVNFNGSSPQKIGGASATTFGNLTISNSAGVTLDPDITVNGVLDLSGGNLITGSDTVTISPTGSVVGANPYYVLGNLAEYVPTGNVSVTFEVGTTNNSSSDYTPVTLTFTNVAVAGYMTVSAIAGNIGSSNLVPTVDVNWSVGDDGILNFDTCSATFTFPASDNTGATPLAVTEYDGTNWSYPTVGTQDSTNAQAIGLTSFGDFQLGQDSVAPTAAITTPLDTVNIANAGSENPYSITVTFSDGVAIDVGTVENSSLSVVGPNSFTATFVSLDTYSNGTPRTALYQFTHSWIPGVDEGTYTVNSPTSVTDTAGNPVASGTLGTFVVDLTDPALDSINLDIPSGQLTNATSVTFLASFSEAVTGVNAGNFILSGTASAGTIGTPVSSDGGVTWTIPVTGLTGPGANGILELDLNNNTDIADLAGNPLSTGTLSGQNYILDNIAPFVSSVDPTAFTITDALIGEGTFQLLITYSEDMDTSIAPAVTFDPAISSTLTPNAGSSGWSDPTTYFYLAGYDVAPSVAYVPSITVSVTGAQDLAGNLQDEYNDQPAGFTIDTVNPTVTSITSSAPYINIASAGQTFSIAVTYNTNGAADMDTDLNFAPTISFSQAGNPVDLSSILTFESGIWSDIPAIPNNVYTAYYTVTDSDAGLVYPNEIIDVTANGAQNLDGNSQVFDIPSSLFTIDTVAPEVSLNSVTSPTANNEPPFSGYGGIDSGDSSTVTVNIYSGSDTTGSPVQTWPATPDPDTGFYTVTLSSALNDGIYTAQASQSDAAGNTGTSSTTTFTVDTMAPTSSASSPAYSKTTTFTVSYTANDSGSGLAEVDIYAEGPTDSGYSLADSFTGASLTTGSFSYSASEGDGNYSFYSIATDNAGNAQTTPGNPDTTTLLDTAAPTSSASSPAYSKTTTFTVSYTANDPAPVPRPWPRSTSTPKGRPTAATWRSRPSPAPA